MSVVHVYSVSIRNLRFGNAGQLVFAQAFGEFYQIVGRERRVVKRFFDFWSGAMTKCRRHVQKRLQQVLKKDPFIEKHFKL